MIGKDLFDLAASCDISRAMFEPATLVNQDYVLDYNLELNDYKPSSKTKKEKQFKRTLPSSLTGIEGVFNSVYKCPDVLYKHALGDYAPSDEKDPLNAKKRWTYRGASTIEGIRFEDNGELLHSEHESDPLFFNKVRSDKKQWSAFELYAYFVHNGSIVNAEKEASKDSLVLSKLSQEFENIDSYVQENQKKGMLLNVLTRDDLTKHICNQNFHEVLSFILESGFIVAKGNKVELVFPIQEVEVYKEFDSHKETYVTRKHTKLDFFNLAIGAPVSSFFGFCGTIIDPQNPKKKISPTEYLVKYSKNLKRYDGYTFQPFNPYSNDIIETGSKINMFNGYATQPNFNYTSEENKLSLDIVLDYIFKVVCSSDKGANEWVLDWIADIVQNPAVKPGTALVLYSLDRGVGKSTLFVLLKAILGVLAQSLPHDMLQRRFNHNLAYCLLGFLDDISFQVKKESAQMRNLITAEYKYIEQKGKDGFEVRDCTRYLITSNHKHIVDVDATVEERRYTMLELKDPFPLKNSKDNGDAEYNEKQREAKKAYFNTLYSTINSSADILLGYFLKRKVKSNLRIMYSTTLYEDVSNGGLKAIDVMLQELKFLSYKELKAKFEGEDDFTETDTVVARTQGTVRIKKLNFRNYFKENFDHQITGHKLNHMLRDSSIVNQNSIDFTNRVPGRYCHHRYIDGLADVIAIPEEFFNNL
jgi:hypothetical protein